MNTPTTLTGSRIQTGRLFNEWMRAETVAQGAWQLDARSGRHAVGTFPEGFRRDDRAVGTDNF